MKRHIVIWFGSGSISVYIVNKGWARDMQGHGRWDTACGNLPEVLDRLSRSVSGACDRQSPRCIGVQVRRDGLAGRWVGDRGSPHRVVPWPFRTGGTRGFRATGTGAVGTGLFLVGYGCRLFHGLCCRSGDINGALHFGTPLRPPRPCCDRSMGAGSVCWSCLSCCSSIWVGLLGLALAWTIFVHPSRILQKRRQQRPKYRR